MKKIYYTICLFILITACKNSKPDLNGNEKIKAEDFLAAFTPVKLPATIYDTSLNNFGDSTTISKAVFTEFINDTALQPYADKNYTIHTAGSIHKKENDYLLATFSSAKQTSLGVFVLDDKHKFLASFFLLNSTEKDNYTHSVSITEEPTFILKTEKNIKNQNYYNKNGYAYDNSLKKFSIVLHDSNEDTAKMNEIINPIDTLPSTNKFSGDYVADKKNYISVRDGKNAITYSFFIHFEKNNGDCTGELKGMMELTTEKTATFSESGDPCNINFKFTANSINIKEAGNCGNHRGITCPFDFTFTKKKLVQAKTK